MPASLARASLLATDPDWASNANPDVASMIKSMVDFCGR